MQTRWQYNNVATKKSAEKRLQRLWHGSRDSARTPVQWSDEANAGFTSGTPWFYVNENYKEVNVAQQENDENSVLNFYRKAITLRKELPCVKDGVYKEYGKNSKTVYTYSRTTADQKMLVICSFSEQPQQWKAPKGFDMNTAQLVLANYENTDTNTLKPYEARVYLWK